MWGHDRGTQKSRMQMDPFASVINGDHGCRQSWCDLIWGSFPMNKESSEMAWSSCWNHRILALLRLSSSHRRSIWSEHAGIGFMIYVFHEILESCEWLAWQFACTQFMDFRILGLSWMTNRRSLTSYPRGFCGEMWCLEVFWCLWCLKAWEIPLWSLCYPRLPHLLHFLRIRAKIK